MAKLDLPARAQAIAPAAVGCLKVDRRRAASYGPPGFTVKPRVRKMRKVSVMKVRNSLKSLKKRHRDNRIVRRKGRVYVINKTNPRFKARQG